MSESILMERESGGVVIQLKFMPLVDLIGVQVLHGEYMRWRTVDPKDAMDAFMHPFCGKYIIDNPWKEVGNDASDDSSAGSSG